MIHAADEGGDGENSGNGNGKNNGNGSSKHHGKHRGSGGSGSSSGGSGSSGGGSSSGPVVNADHTAPTVTITAPDVTQASGVDEHVTVVFTDDHAVHASGIASSALSVNGPADINVTGVSVSQDGTSSVTALFTIAAPAGGWAANQNGAYTLSIAGGAASDDAGNRTSSGAGSFSVNLPHPAGSIDSGFGSGVAITAPFVAEAVAAQADGKLLVAGHQGDPAAGQSQGVVERLNADGSIDTSFGVRGQVLTVAGHNDAYFSIVLQPDGHFIVVGSTASDTSRTAFLIQRFDAAGKVDASYGKGGRTVTDFGGQAGAYAATLSSTGGIVAGGTSDGQFAFAAYTSSGNLDRSFGQGGRQLLSMSISSDAIGAITTTSNGKIIAAGASGTHVVLLRLTASGEADPSFDVDGFVTVAGLAARQTPGTIDHAEGLAVDASGRILVAGQTSAGHFGIERLNPDGKVDATFGTAGIATANFGGIDHADSILLGDNGQLIVLGTTSLAGVTSTSVAAFDSSGNPVSTFGTGGQISINPNVGVVQRELHVNDLVLRAFGVLQNGKLVVGTSTPSAVNTPSSTTTTLRRILIAPTTDPLPATSVQTFGKVGKKQQPAVFTLPDGGKATIGFQGGTGTAMLVGSHIRLVVTAASAQGAALSVKVAGGSGRVTLDDVTVTGSLRSFKGASADLAGSLFASGTIGTVELGQVTGTIAAAGGAIRALSVASLSGAHILSGANLGSDGRLGGSGSKVDGFAGGSIGALRVSGDVSASVVGAGLNPVDGLFVNGNDLVIGGTASSIRTILVRGSVDGSSRFAAGAFGSIRIPQRVDPMQDVHVLVLS